MTGVAWSEDDWYLASVGLDSLVYIWDMDSCSVLRRLDAHQGFVKGVVWDPAGQFLATQSDDRSVKVWRTTDWGVEANITDPFIDCPTSTFFRRLSWSPDGTHLTTPNSMNGPVFVSAVIDRYKWDSTFSLVGHQNIVEVVSFNPTVFLREPNLPPEGANFCTVLALGARNSVSIWQTNSSEPIVVLHDVFDRDILDLCWSSDGLTLYASSSEGQVAAFAFDPSEFAVRAPPGSKERWHSTYNFRKPPRQHAAGAVAYPHAAPLPPGQVNMLQPRRPAVNGVPRSGTPISEQETTVMANGKKRIRPAFLGAAGEPPFAPFMPPAAPNGFAIPQPPQIPPMPRLWDYDRSGRRVPAQPVASPAGPSQSRKRRATTELEPFEDERLSRTKGRTLGGDREMSDFDPLPTDLRPAYVPIPEDEVFKRVEVAKGMIECLAVPKVVSFSKVSTSERAEDDILEVRNYPEGDRQCDLFLLSTKS